MKNLKNTDKLKGKKKTAPKTPPPKDSGSMGRQIGNDLNTTRKTNIPNNIKKPNDPKKPLPSQKAKPVGNKKAVKKQPVKKTANNQRNGINGSNPELQKRPAASAARPAKPSAPAKPVDKRARKAADKAARNKQAAAAVKKNKYHGGSYILYYIMAAIIVMIILIILANTVLFRCKNISVTGNTRYSAEQIIGNSELAIGQNLLHMNRNGAAEKIVSALAYVDSASVKKSFPSTIEISVTEAERRFAVREGGVIAAVSYGGKIVEQGIFSDLPLVVGMECESVEIGSRLKSKIESKNSIPGAILDAADSAMMKNITRIDVTDRFSLDMELDNGRIIIKLGTASDLENKVKIAKEFVDTEVGEAESVTIIVSNPTRVTLRPNIPADDLDIPGSPETSGNPETSSTSGNSSTPETASPAVSSQ